MIAPQTLIFSTTEPGFDGDEVIVDRANTGNAIVFIQIFERERIGGSASVFLTFDEASAMRDQLDSLLAGYGNEPVAVSLGGFDGEISREVADVFASIGLLR